MPRRAGVDIGGGGVWEDEDVDAPNREFDSTWSTTC